jgi:GNAT superfamily N-acetyltransferase
MALFRETADVSVRPAMSEDDASITRVQLRAWRTSHAEVLGAETLEGLDVAVVRERWAAAITEPPSRQHRVLVACDGAQVVGVAASAPVAAGGAGSATDAGSAAGAGSATGAGSAPDAAGGAAGAGSATGGAGGAPGVEILTLEVDPDHQRGGHGSRLLAACVDLAREDGATHLQTWVLQGDAAREQFLASAGLGPDGACRELAPSTVGEGEGEATGQGRSQGGVAEHRWVAEI